MLGAVRTYGTGENLPSRELADRNCRKRVRGVERMRRPGCRQC
nr:MAG TPA: hypothetical protein [Caudoviricetes sp.]